MSASIAEVVAQLRAAADQLDTSVATATRAKADAEQARSNFTEAGRGSNHRHSRAAVDDSSVAAAKAGKIGRLLAQAANHLNEYINHIAPGSAPVRVASDTALPSGEDLVTESRQREDRRRKINGFLGKAVRQADDVQDHASQGMTAVEAVGKLFRHPHGSGTHSSGTTSPSAPPTPAPAKIDGGEAAGNLVVVGLLAGVAFQRASEFIKRRIARARREHDGQSE